MKRKRETVSLYLNKSTKSMDTDARGAGTAGQMERFPVKHFDLLTAVLKGGVIYDENNNWGS